MASPSASVAVALIGAGGALCAAIIGGIFQLFRGRGGEGPVDPEQVDPAVLTSALQALVRERDLLETKLSAERDAALAERDAAKRACQECELKLAIIRGRRKP
ncbi:MAG: hypothetical protein ACXVYY_00890 [Oryzihumus sp.]